MDRTTRLAFIGALALLVVLAGTVVATRAPVADDPGQQLADEHDEGEAADEVDEPPEQEAIDRAAERLGVDAARVQELAAEHGFGTAVRLLAWEAEGVDIGSVLDRRAAGEGWGLIAKHLKEQGFDVHPGIGSVMGNGGGHGRDHAPGQQKQDDAGD